MQVKNWLLSKHPTVSTEPVALMAHPAVQALISDEIVSACAGLKSYERPQVWTVILEPFTTVSAGAPEPNTYNLHHLSFSTFISVTVHSKN